MSGHLTHYLSPLGGMLHAITSGFGTLDAKADWELVTCDICLASRPMTDNPTEARAVCWRGECRRQCAYPASCAARPAPAVPDEEALDQALQERDDAQEWADRLAYAIAPQEVIGEHTSLNNPWQNALGAAARDAAQVAALRARVEAVLDSRQSKTLRRNIEGLIGSAFGDRCVDCKHVTHNELGYCQVGQCSCEYPLTANGQGRILRRDTDDLFAALRAALNPEEGQ